LIPLEDLACLNVASQVHIPFLVLFLGYGNSKKYLSDRIETLF